MVSNIAVALVGLSLFLSGMKMVSSSMKQMASRQMRQMFAQWAGNPVGGFIGGVFSGAIFQSGSNTAFIMSSLVASGFIPIRNALPVIAAANIGTAALVFLVAVIGDIKLIVMFFLAVAGIFNGLVKRDHWQHGMKALFGIGLLLYGFQTLQGGVKPLTQLEILNNFLANDIEIFLKAFIFGAIMRIITFSSSAVTMLVIMFTEIGMFGFSQAISMVYGGCVGAAIATYVLAGQLKGIARQISSFQTLFELSAGIGLYSLFILATLTGLPMVEAVLPYLVSDIGAQVAYVYLLTRIVPTVFVLALRDDCIMFLQKINPPTKVDDIAKPEFIYEAALDEPETAMALTEREQLRIIRYMVDCLEHSTAEGENGSVKYLESALRSLEDEVKFFITELFAQQHTLATTERLVNIQNRQKAIVSLHVSIFAICHIIQDSGNRSSNLTTLASNIKEGLLTILITALEGAESGDGEDLNLVLQMTEKRTDFLEELRRNCLLGEREIPQDERAILIDITDQYQHVVWIIRQWVELLAAYNKGTGSLL